MRFTIFTGDLKKQEFIKSKDDIYNRRKDGQAYLHDLPPLGQQHLHQEGGVGRIPLYVLEVKVFLPSLQIDTNVKNDEERLVRFLVSVTDYKLFLQNKNKV